jgi:N-carbamoyl-L-amino-acid hydrolase
MSTDLVRNLSVTPARIAADIADLAAITEPDRPYTRRSFTPMFLRGREYLARRFAAAGLETHIDAAGNLIGRRAGKIPGRGTIMVGSHSDTVPDGGRFDGVAGVAAALEIARALADKKIVLDHDLEVVDFLAEEVSAFGLSCVGSRGMSGQLKPEMLAREVDGRTLAEGIAETGGDATRLGAPLRTDIKAFLELHIEQGTVLEEAHEDVGVVTAIAGITRIEIFVNGRADHAGTTRMTHRQDALVTAAALVTAINQWAKRKAEGPAHFAATVGEFSIEPNAANVVPARARLLIDARAELRADMEDFQGALAEIVGQVAADTGVAIDPPVTISDNLPTPGDADVLNILDAACDAVGARHRRMASGAGHDTAWMARLAKAAMIFIPCRGGRSHTPEEWAETDDIALGAAVLLEAVVRLDRELG